METEDLILDNSSQRKIVKEFSELFPDIWISILSQTFIVKTIPIRNSPRQILMSLLSIDYIKNKL